jgi:hypothetical protein
VQPFITETRGSRIFQQDGASPSFSNYDALLQMKVSQPSLIPGCKAIPGLLICGSFSPLYFLSTEGDSYNERDN